MKTKRSTVKCRCGHPKDLHYDYPSKQLIADQKRYAEIRNLHYEPQVVHHLCMGKPKDTLTDVCRCMKFRKREKS